MVSHDSSTIKVGDLVIVVKSADPQYTGITLKVSRITNQHGRGPVAILESPVNSKVAVATLPNPIAVDAVIRVARIPCPTSQLMVVSGFDESNDSGVETN